MLVLSCVLSGLLLTNPISYFQESMQLRGDAGHSQCELRLLSPLQCPGFWWSCQFNVSWLDRFCIQLADLRQAQPCRFLFRTSTTETLSKDFPDVGDQPTSTY